jgi:hypothetical protein
VAPEQRTATSEVRTSGSGLFIAATVSSRSSYPTAPFTPTRPIHSLLLLRHFVLVVCCALLCLTAIMSRAHRGSTTPMDFEWSNKHGPVDQRSPFMTAVDAAQHARKREHPRRCPSLLPPLTSMARPSLCPRLPQAPRRRLHNTQPSPAARTRRPQLSLRSRLDPPIALIHSRTRPERLDAAHPDHRLRFQLRR